MTLFPERVSGIRVKQNQKRQKKEGGAHIVGIGRETDKEEKLGTFLDG
jgi:hypothetical protein